MDTGTAALIVFFGLFWAAAIGACGRYRAFDTAAIFRGGFNGRPALRLAFGLLLINAWPTFLLYVLYACHTFAGLRSSSEWSLVAAATASLSVFSTSRFVHAFMATRGWWKYFYTEDELTSVLKAYGYEALDGFWLHFLGGLGYVAIPIAVAILLLRNVGVA